MIDAPQKGVIAILDEECMRPGKTSDQTFLEKVGSHFFCFRRKKGKEDSD